MTDLFPHQYVLIGLIFIWSGFVRSGLGFGGAVLSLPFLLLVHNDALIFLPIISVQLLFFSSLIIVSNNYRQFRQHTLSRSASTVNWSYLGRLLAIMIVPKLLGVFGLINLPSAILSPIIFVIVMLYALGYIFDRPITSNNRKVDILLLVIGAYISGTSLIGAPLIIAVVARHLDRHQLRDTLLALWFILVTIKLAAFIWAGVDLQLWHHLWLLPCAAIGHFAGLQAHKKLQAANSRRFFIAMGSILLLVSSVGLWTSLMQQ